jgi:hypothetical protein
MMKDGRRELYKGVERRLALEQEGGGERCNLDPISHFVENRPRFGCDSRARILQLDGGQLKGSARQDQLNRAE